MEKIMQFLKNLSKEDKDKLCRWYGEKRGYLEIGQDTAMWGAYGLAECALWFARKFPEETFTANDLLFNIGEIAKEK